MPIVPTVGYFFVRFPLDVLPICIHAYPMSIHEPKPIRKKPDFKIRPGFSDEELEDFRNYLVTHGYGPGGGSFARHALLLAIGKTPQDIREESE